MAIKFEINLASYGEPVIEQEINAPRLTKEGREIKVILPLGYERLKYKLFFIDLSDGNIIGPFFNGQVVNFGSFGSRVKIKAILDKEYRISFSDTIEIPMHSYGEYCSFCVSYDYSGLIDIDYNNLARSNDSFSSEAALLERAKVIMEPILRAVISQILTQNHSSTGGISSELFFNLETNVNAAIQNGFHKLCTDCMSWCNPLGCIKIKNTNMKQIMETLNTPTQIERKREQAVFEAGIRMRDQALISAAEIEKERIQAAAQIGATGVYEPDVIQSLTGGSNYLDLISTVPGLNLDISTPNLSYLTDKDKK